MSESTNRKAEQMGNKMYLSRLIGVTAVIAYFNAGYCLNLYGPTLLDLLQQTKVSWDRMGILLMGRSSCAIVGAMLAGLSANCSLVSLLLVLALCQAVLLVGQVLTPLCTSQTEILLVFIVQGLFNGAISFLAHFLPLLVYGQSAHAWLQALYVAVSGAVLLAPIVATPFLSETAARQQSLVSCNPVTNITTTIQVDTLLADDVDLRVPFWTSAVTCFVAFAFCVLSAFWTRVSRFETAKILNRGPVRRLKADVVVLAFFLVTLYTSLCALISRFLFSFAVKSKLCMNVKVAGMVAALYGGANCLMRCLCTVIAALRPSLANPTRLLTVNHVALSIALISILVGRDVFAPAVWIFAFSAGIGISNGVPSLMTLMKSQGASKRVIAVLTIGAPLGIALGPFITTFIMSDNAAGPGSGFYSVFCVVTHLATLLFGSLMSKIGSQATHERSQGELSDQNMNIADMEDACEKRS